MWIERFYTKIIHKYLQQFPVVFVTGARQTGKTSLLEKDFLEYNFCSLDQPKLAKEAEESPEDFLTNSQKSLIIDEVQYAPKLFRYIKIVVDKNKKKGQFILTGSQNFQLMQNISESLAGRCGIITMSGISGQERKNNKKLPISGIEVLIRGSFPELVAKQVLDPNNWFSGYVSTYLERDVRNILRVTSLRDFSIFLSAVALRSGQILSYSDLARDVGISVSTTREWISVLETSQIIYLLRPYHRNLGKRLFKSPKIYLRDTGLMCYLSGLTDLKSLSSSPMIGAIWETYVLNQILSSYQEKGMTPNLWFWRTQAGQEVDFLIDKGGMLTAIEAKYAEDPNMSNCTKGYNALKRFYGDKFVDKLLIATKNIESYKIGKDIYLKSGWFWE